MRSVSNKYELLFSRFPQKSVFYILVASGEARIEVQIIMPQLIVSKELVPVTFSELGDRVASVIES